MRIIAGRFKGLPIPSALKGTRPTTDRTKEAMFSRLDAWGALDGARVLDLYAGTGALGFEALSRGAKTLVAVEASRKAASLIGDSLSRLKASPAWEPDDRAQVLPLKAERYALSGQRGAGGAQVFDLVFMDPPYGLGAPQCDAIVDALVDGCMVGAGSVIILERSSRSQPPRPPRGWTLTESRAYGETVVHYIEHARTGEAAG
ncbi:16S rRNA (guanine(966)-N(2))-methyltransferase RsmD [Bifidobacterium xylocopae]|uniref:16S rRNA (Guanine(966)-N(2))-methyltransferase RsmD n=1 Tax=Bifidobacterium xylocopae TaxID=2493119 RepID=A0A366KDC3_9BIFI|nr:16S rRNA (guanine(966)-N(2))-methyltransferase RsmD [Bifidobacterium xylocopae]RBP99745.1 16S rRNA (guanine(966)-N(2))-methyltransferase RsmD [Bifidobacterium xylocopae]